MARQEIRFGIGPLLAAIVGTAGICFLLMGLDRVPPVPTDLQEAKSSLPKPSSSSLDSPVAPRRQPTPKANPDQSEQHEGMGISNRPPSSRWTLPASGILPSGLARELGFNAEQTKAAQSEITRFRKKMEDSVSARAYRDEDASEPEIDVYRIPALPDGGQALRDELESKLADIGGKDAAAELIETLGTEVFGGYGRYDVTVKFSPDAERSEVGHPIQADYVYTDPENGTKVLWGNSTLDSFSEKFGNWKVVADDQK